MSPLPIGVVSLETGVKVSTIRYYEEIGLLPRPDRAGNNRRTYGQDTVRRLRFIRHARDLGFEIEAVRRFLSLAVDPNQSCEDADRIARAHLAEIESKIARLEALREEMRRMLQQGAHGEIKDCRVIEVLGDHSLCLSEAH